MIFWPAYFLPDDQAEELRRSDPRKSATPVLVSLVRRESFMSYTTGDIVPPRLDHGARLEGLV